MLLPKRVKFRKQHRGRMTGKAMRGNTVSHGEYGLQALQPAWITSNQIEAARIAMTRYYLFFLNLYGLIFLYWKLYNKSASTIFTVFCFDCSSGTIYNPFYKCKT